MRVLADLLLVGLVVMATLTGVVVAETVGIHTEADLLSYIFDPKTGSLAISIGLNILLWRALQKSDEAKEMLHGARVDDARMVADVVKEQRAYHDDLRDRIFQQELDVRTALERAVIVVERVEKKLDGA